MDVHTKFQSPNMPGTCQKVCGAVGWGGVGGCKPILAEQYYNIDADEQLSM